VCCGCSGCRLRSTEFDDDDNEQSKRHTIGKEEGGEGLEEMPSALRRGPSPVSGARAYLQHENAQQQQTHSRYPRRAAH
jgi:hypothetical protein